MQKCWFTRTWTSYKDYHFFFNVFNGFIEVISSLNDLAIFWDIFWVESFDLDFIFFSQIQIFRSQKFNANVKSKF